MKKFWRKTELGKAVLKAMTGKVVYENKIDYRFTKETLYFTETKITILIQTQELMLLGRVYIRVIDENTHTVLGDNFTWWDIRCIVAKANKIRKEQEKIEDMKVKTIRDKVNKEFIDRINK